MKKSHFARVLLIILVICVFVFFSEDETTISNTAKNDYTENVKNNIEGNESTNFNVVYTYLPSLSVSDFNLETSSPISNETVISLSENFSNEKVTENNNSESGFVTGLSLVRGGSDQGLISASFSMNNWQPKAAKSKSENKQWQTQPFIVTAQVLSDGDNYYVAPIQGTPTRPVPLDAFAFVFLLPVCLAIGIYKLSNSHPEIHP